MLNRALLFLASIASLLPLNAGAAIHTLYAASVRTGVVAQGEAPIAGNLYTINLANGTATLVGAIRLPGSKPIGVTGMAAHPNTGMLYGITSEQSPNHPRALVTIDAKTGTAALVGDLGVTGSDIA